MADETQDQDNELSPERRARVIARFRMGKAYREAARLRDRADQLEEEAAM